MKLKNILVLAFLTLTLIPIIIMSLLLYRSGFNLSKASYMNSLTESINVQSDYIAQTIKNNMISDYRFASRNDVLLTDANVPPDVQRTELLKAFELYLKSSEGEITVCILMDKSGEAIYTVGEKKMLDAVSSQLPILSGLSGQTMMEFELKPSIYSLGVITPVYDDSNAYAGSLISVYDESYIFKIISSYYEISDTSTYICRQSGDVISYRGLPDEKRNNATTQALSNQVFNKEGVLNIRVDNTPVAGYYKNIYNSPWHLVGVIDDKLIYNFTNQFVLGYIFIIIGVLIADVILSFYFSKRVVEPINALIKVMEGYKNDLNSSDLHCSEKNGYYETKYLCSKFLDLMQTIMLVQHNFEGIYQLYQSNDMDDMNIDIDVKKQTVISNKEVFQELMNGVEVPEGACIVERFVSCFCEKDKVLLMTMFENMRDHHLSVTSEAEVYTPHFGEKWYHSLVVPMYENDRLSRLFIQLRDISNFKKQELQSSETARRDALTGLYNRTGFVEYVKKFLQDAPETDLHGLLFIDMDYFKMVNDNFGHSAGDDLLCTVGDTLVNIIGAQGFASRFGGDEFVVFFPQTSQEEVTRVKQEISKNLIYPFSTDKISFVVSASIGVTTWSRASGETLETLLKQADIDMYEAKRKFKEGTGK